MKKYMVMLRQSVLDSLAYGPVAFVWILVEIVELAAPLAIWYGSTPIGGSIGGYSKPQILAYYALIAIVRGFTAWYIHYPVAQLIRSGDFSNLLVKPISSLIQVYFSEGGWKIMRTIVQMPITLAIIFLFVYRLPPADYSSNLLFFLSLVAGLIMSLLITTCFATLSFWVTELGGINGLYFFVNYVFSGELAPLSVYPAWFKIFVDFSPFRFTLSFPLELFFKRLSSTETISGFLVMCSWLVILAVTARRLWNSGIRNHQAYGK